jgi:hypothetical protein
VRQTVTFTATVRDPAGTATPTGTVTFMVGNRAVAMVKLVGSGKASIAGVFSLAGVYTIQAIYSGDGNFAASSGALIARVSG